MVLGVYRRFIRNDSGEQKSDECALCWGTGKLSDESVSDECFCPRCGGSGK